MIAIVDYGVGNLRAFLNVYKRLNIAARTAANAGELSGATKLILPGVGNFDDAMERLNASGMRPALETMVRDERVPVLGVCVGMQMLAQSSAEGNLPGLGWIEGRVTGFATWKDASGLPLPHMGWNDVRSVSGHGLFKQLESDARFYFLHSFFFECARPGDSAAVARYGGDFSCAVSSGNIHGVQFHPEKSHQFGTRLLQNFAEL